MPFIMQKLRRRLTRIPQQFLEDPERWIRSHLAQTGNRYGRGYDRIFPREDGYVTLVSLYVTSELEKKGSSLGEHGNAQLWAICYRSRSLAQQPPGLPSRCTSVL